MDQLESHERVCAERYRAIEQRLESGTQRMARLEALIWCVYPFIVSAVVLSKYL